MGKTQRPSKSSRGKQRGPQSSGANTGALGVRGSLSSRPDGAAQKKGFQVGPKPFDGMYRGKAQKIKQTLIHKAQIKKAYNRVLKSEGAETSTSGSRAVDASGEEGFTARSRKPSAKPKLEQPAPAAKKRPRLSETELAELRQKRLEQHKQYNARTKKGQPNTNAKMGVLLDKIQRSILQIAVVVQSSWSRCVTV
ncbi:uncharacterized protein L969DRAFT_54314 [Mixia osmundae IAM 14324]|uniref:rRNA-processing protein FYV7 n=1 Tax=Mixia osmundae (strain CBS 9802 / IAM 14324 / JCM 22182 / KY 12970) TaxID=764103 RepID=G7E267_MIXOS|nr:uncharacterized protein L969DRAFT_54314 [Mixia osmundae IAM 14324]KEI36799.1 hypothetical protein L969DRAFT_54314 [Mixia osmundae IAM 14324]GAA96927.1 hypothetical protein E5Q_03601 [Mixia osmundae IAM 14324]